MGAVLVSMMVLLAGTPPTKAGRAAKATKAKAERPLKCAKITDQAVAILNQAVSVLTTESRRKGARSPKAAKKALNAYLLKNTQEMRELRNQAAALKLDDPTFRACEEDANKAFLKVLARFSVVRSFYRADPETFRMIGDLFR